MMLLTAKATQIAATQIAATSTAVRQIPKAPAARRHHCKQPPSGAPMRDPPIPRDLIFASLIANFLEIRRIGFHYSVMGRPRRHGYSGLWIC